MALMPSDAEYLADRRRIRRKLSFWRVIGVLAMIAALVAVGWRFADISTDRFTGARDHVARVEVSGLITSDRRFVEMLDEIGESRTTRGVVVSINSPGGTVTGSEELYHALRRLAERKPLVAFVDGSAASGAYIAALASDRIIARETAIVGSIGVIFQMPNVVELLDSLGIVVREVKSAPLKAAPSPLTVPPPGAFEALQVVVDDTYAWFVELVDARRPQLGGPALAQVADGRVWNGRQSVSLGLVDALGTERDAIAWLEVERDVPTDLPVRNWEPRRERSTFGFVQALATGARALGFEDVAAALLQAHAASRFNQLDGLLAIWQPRAEN